MTQSNFPFLTPAVLEMDGDNLLTSVVGWWPQTAVLAAVARPLLPLVAHIPAVASAIQKLCDEMNKITGAVAAV
jgi:hypothetical protein